MNKVNGQQIAFSVKVSAILQDMQDKEERIIGDYRVSYHETFNLYAIQSINEKVNYGEANFQMAINFISMTSTHKY